MSPLLHLATINFFLGDIQGGLGPFLATWLAAHGHWSPGRVGSVTTVVGLGTLLLNGPAGALVDRLGRPRLLLASACAAILAGTLLILIADGFWGVLLAQFVAASGGTMVMPALTSLTLGIVGKDRFPQQQGRNQAFNHGGVLAAAVLIGSGGAVLGPETAFWVLAGMAAAAIVAVATTPGAAWNGRRAHGWNEDEPDKDDHSHPVLAVLANRRLMIVTAALTLFALSNGSMLPLLGQKLVATGHPALRWIAGYVIVAQLTMIPVALWAGSLADRRGRRHLLLLACAAMVARAILSALVGDPYWLIGAEVLDGVASGVLGVAVPVLVADLTWTTGRTQTALGAVNTVQGAGGALSGVASGLLVGWFGWTGAFLALAVPVAVALALALWLEETRDAEPGATASGLRRRNQTAARDAQPG
jgi:MFS family permease